MTQLDCVKHHRVELKEGVVMVSMTRREKLLALCLQPDRLILKVHGQGSPMLHRRGACSFLQLPIATLYSAVMSACSLVVSSRVWAKPCSCTYAKHPADTI